MPRTQLSRKADTRRDLIAEIEYRKKERKLTYSALGMRFGVTGEGMRKRIKSMTLGYSDLVDLMELLEFPPEKILWYASGGRFRHTA